MVFDDNWWCLMTFDECWWYLNRYNEIWWDLMLYDVIWWDLMRFDYFGLGLLKFDLLWWDLMRFNDSSELCNYACLKMNSRLSKLSCETETWEFKSSFYIPDWEPKRPA